MWWTALAPVHIEIIVATEASANAKHSAGEEQYIAWAYTGYRFSLCCLVYTVLYFCIELVRHYMLFVRHRHT